MLGSRTSLSGVTKTPFNNFNTGFYNSDDNLSFSNTTVETDQVAKQSITIDNSLIRSASPIQNDGITRILAGERIEILPSSQIDPSSILMINRLGMDCGSEFNLASASEISAACLSAEYQALRSKSSASYNNSSNVDEANKILNIACFPNPASDFLHITLSEKPSNSEIDIRLKDLSGRIVLIERLVSNSGSLFRLNLSGLTTGTYLLEVEANSKVSLERVIIN